MEREFKRRGGGTLGTVKRHRHEIVLHCRRERCGRRAVANLEALIARFGAAFPIDEVMGHVVCVGCGARFPYVEWWALPTDDVAHDPRLGPKAPATASRPIVMASNARLLSKAPR